MYGFLLSLWFCVGSFNEFCFLAILIAVNGRTEVRTIAFFHFGLTVSDPNA